MRINKYIANSGICSRRKAEEYINSDKVIVNGNILNDLAYQVTEADKIAVNGKLICEQNEKKYVILNKPCGVVTTAKEQFGRPCVLDIVKQKERLYPVGRLDMDSEGLIILTNDGEFTNKITHPSKHVGKTYLIETNNRWKGSDVKKMEEGIQIDGKITAKAKVNKAYNNTIEITIYEGRNRQLRKMCESLGYTVIRLQRIAIGKLTLGDLTPGKYIEVTRKELDKIWE